MRKALLVWPIEKEINTVTVTFSVTTGLSGWGVGSLDVNTQLPPLCLKTAQSSVFAKRNGVIISTYAVVLKSLTLP